MSLFNQANNHLVTYQIAFHRLPFGIHLRSMIQSPRLEVHQESLVMPVTASAAKALRRDRRRTQVNRRWRSRLKVALDQFTDQPSASSLTSAYSILDRATKHQLLHPHKAARLKSRLAKELTAPPTLKTKPKTTAKKKPTRKPVKK